MIRNTTTDYEKMEQMTLMREGDRSELITYLTDKWQEAFNMISETVFGAYVVLHLTTEEGYQTIMSCDQSGSLQGVGIHRDYTGDDFADLVRASERILLIENGKDDQRLRDSYELGLGYTNMIGIPINNTRGDVIGVLSVLRTGPVNIENRDITLTGWLATSLEESIKNYELSKIIVQLGMEDRLTHLITRKRMMTMIQEEFDRSQRSEMPFSLVVIDIDDFRGINESHGHEVGDGVLKEFSKLIMDRIRHIDYACRWDGNAFAIMLPQTEMIGANQLVSDLFFNLTHHVFADVGRCYFSMGIADFAANDLSIDDILLRLDKALYRVKAFGGNNHISRYH